MILPKEFVDIFQRMWNRSEFNIKIALNFQTSLKREIFNEEWDLNPGWETAYNSNFHAF
jgi:hypothetical protein